SKSIINRMAKWNDELRRMRIELIDNRNELEKLNGYSRIYKINEFLIDTISKYNKFIKIVDKILEA
ncbi:MAG: hypothetical protein ACFFDF_21615, partial [Candidatus Odinarchaeota archaeon]